MQLILKEAGISDLVKPAELVVLVLEHISGKVILDHTLILLIVHRLDERRVVISQLSDLLLVLVVLVSQELNVLHLLLLLSDVLGDFVFEVLHL